MTKEKPPSTEEELIGQELYTGTADFGRIMAIIGAVIATLIGIGMIIGGIVALHHTTTRTAQVQGEVTNNNPCTPTAVNNVVKYNCIIDVTFTLSAKVYTANFINNNSNINYRKGDAITVYYDPKNPSDNGLLSDNSKIVGWVLLGIAPFIILFAWLWVYITRKSKVAAAAGGVASIFDMFRR